MKAFRVIGTFLMKNRWQNFVKEVAAEDAAQAKQKVLSDLGSKHRVSRRMIKVEKLEEIPADKVEDHVVRWRIGGKK